MAERNWQLEYETQRARADRAERERDVAIRNADLSESLCIENDQLRARVERLAKALREYVINVFSGGAECEICYACWDDGEEERHRDSCPLAALADEKAGE